MKCKCWRSELRNVRRPVVRDLGGFVARDSALCINDELSRNRSLRHWSSLCLCASGRTRCCVSVDTILSLWAFSADVTSLAASVAGLSSLLQWSTIRSCAVPADVTELAASIALHGLSLAITCEVVRPSTLVTRCGAVVASVASAEAAAISTSWWSPGSTSERCGVRGRAVALYIISTRYEADFCSTYSKMTHLATRVAASTTGSSAQT